MSKAERTLIKLENNETSFDCLCNAHQQSLISMQIYHYSNDFINEDMNTKQYRSIRFYFLQLIVQKKRISRHR